MRFAHRTRDDNSFIAVPPCLPPEIRQPLHSDGNGITGSD